LPPSQRDALRLRIVDELEYERVAEELGTSPATARVRVHRGLAALRARLAKPKETDDD
jgi:RNA polymerase sigma-70 factor (ECF subfamily)